jgi:hypothetical protein
MGRIGEVGRLTKASQQICFPAYGLGPVKPPFKLYREQGDSRAASDRSRFERNGSLNVVRRL